MSNLLSIETNFLNLQQVKAALNLQEIRAVQRTITNAKKKKFDQTLALSKLVTKAVEWFKSQEGLRVCAEEGISWSNEEIGQKVFGWQKSFFYKVVKAGNLQATTIDSFITKCDEVERNGEEPNRSLEGLLRYAKQVENPTSDGGIEGDSISDPETQEAEVETRVATIMTFVFKSEQTGNVSVRIDANHELKTNNTKEEIETAIAFLTYSIINL